MDNRKQNELEDANQRKSSWIVVLVIVILVIALYQCGDFRPDYLSD